MESFGTIINGFYSLTIVIKRFISDENFKKNNLIVPFSWIDFNYPKAAEPLRRDNFF